MSTLDQIARDLAYAAGQGARSIAGEVAATARMRAEVGTAVALPGPGLRAALGHAPGSTEAAAAAEVTLPDVLQRGAVQAAEAGVDAALGRRR